MSDESRSSTLQARSTTELLPGWASPGVPAGPASPRRWLTEQPSPARATRLVTATLS